jgi:hypothetical protein
MPRASFEREAVHWSYSFAADAFVEEVEAFGPISAVASDPLSRVVQTVLTQRARAPLLMDCAFDQAGPFQHFEVL